MSNSNIQYSNKRIATNTIFLYVQMFASLFINLYMSRIVLHILGVSDYGIYGVVGGILSLFTFITGSLSAATSRFLNAELGNPQGDIKKVFNINQTLHFVFALLVIILAETIGLWYVYNKLCVPEGKIGDAIFVYQVCIITTAVGINNSPWGALFASKEKFKFISLFETGNLIIRLALILLLQLYEGNSLRLYAIIMSLTTFTTFFTYHILGKKRWPEIVKFKFIKGWKNYKPILNFGGWNILSTISFMARSTGTDLLFNSFFGTSINGAYAISKHANNHISAFSTRFDAASAPQIIQSYNKKDYDRSEYLAIKLGRIALLLFEIAFFPIMIELPFLLGVWLGDVPEYVLIFMRLNLILCGFSLTCGGFNQIISASGRIKWFKIEISFFFLLCIPLGYILFRNGYPPYSILLLFLVADIIQRGVQMIMLKKLLNFDSLKYMKEAWIRPIIIGGIMSVILYVYSFFNIEFPVYKLISIILSFFVTSFLVFYIGLTKGEKQVIIKKVHKIFKLKK